jgi:hypothetical protein
MRKAGFDQGLASNHGSKGIFADCGITDSPEYFTDGVPGNVDSLEDFSHGDSAQVIVIDILERTAISAEWSS